jgi:hypothetical protein
MILPLDTQSNRYEKCSPSWEGLYKIIKIVLGNAYFVDTLDSKPLNKVLNGKYLKRYYPSVWQEA